MSWRSRTRNFSKVLTSALVCGIAVLAWAQDFTFSAKADKTSVKIGDPLNLTITLDGDLTDVKAPPFEFPKEFAVAARSQESNFSLRGRAMERTVSFQYVLVAQSAGSFQLGPFVVERQGKSIKTDPITITVEKSSLPPHFQPQGDRITL